MKKLLARAVDYLHFSFIVGAIVVSVRSGLHEWRAFSGGDEEAGDYRRWVLVFALSAVSLVDYLWKMWRETTARSSRA